MCYQQGVQHLHTGVFVEAKKDFLVNYHLVFYQAI